MVSDKEELFKEFDLQTYKCDYIHLLDYTQDVTFKTSVYIRPRLLSNSIDLLYGRKFRNSGGDYNIYRVKETININDSENKSEIRRLVSRLNSNLDKVNDIEIVLKSHGHFLDQIHNLTIRVVKDTSNIKPHFSLILKSGMLYYFNKDVTEEELKRFANTLDYVLCYNERKKHKAFELFSKMLYDE